MIKYATGAILITLSVAGFFFFTKPLFDDITALNVQVTSYDQALASATALEEQRDKLTEIYNNISPENLTKLQKLLPDNVDNIRLILEIGQLAVPYGMILKDVKYDATSEEAQDTVNAAVPATSGPDAASSDYGTWNLQFTTTGTYDNFISFLQDLQSNLRIIDVSSIDFSSDIPFGTKPVPNQGYNYVFQIKTYWLKH